MRKGTQELEFAKPTVVQQLSSSQHPEECKKRPMRMYGHESLNLSFTSDLIGSHLLALGPKKPINVSAVLIMVRDDFQGWSGSFSE